MYNAGSTKAGMWLANWILHPQNKYEAVRTPYSLFDSNEEFQATPDTRLFSALYKDEIPFWSAASLASLVAVAGKYLVLVAVAYYLAHELLTRGVDPLCPPPASSCPSTFPQISSLIGSDNSKATPLGLRVRKNHKLQKSMNLTAGVLISAKIENCVVAIYLL
jgi:hypothetical protein